MSAAAAQAPAPATRRRGGRHALAVPVDFTVLRSGVPACIPGRSLNVGEAGVAAILAAELRPGDSVGVEFRLPGAGLLQAKAMVRHHARLCCGFEFVGLTAEQRAMVEFWASRASQFRSGTNRGLVAQEGSPTRKLEFPNPALGSSIAAVGQPQRSLAAHRLLSFALFVLVAITAAGWWQWRHAWDDLESRVPRAQPIAESVRVQVPPGVMEQLITHKVDPLYPDAARHAHLPGMVVLKTVIGRDGAVLEVRPLSGPDVLASAAVDAVKWWRFQPYRVNRQPVEVETTFAVDFEGH